MVRMLSNKFCLSLTIILIGGFVGCGVLTSDDEMFSFSRVPYSGNEFRMDGYYYELVSSSENDVPVFRYNIFFFFRNGIMLYGQGPTTSKLLQHEESFSNGEFYTEHKEHKYYWGIFKVDSINGITREYWVNNDEKFVVYRSYADVLNDTTILFTSSERVDGTEIMAENDTLHFKVFSPKPDSVVSFIP